jgi:hypothetical protein
MSTRVTKIRLSPTVVLALAAAVVLWPAEASSQQPTCRVSTQIVRLAELPEASGVAASRRTPGVFWAHNDSEDPVIFALDDRGAVKGRVRVAGAQVDDWEDIAVGPCARGSCLYIGDVGDNSGTRDRITLYRVPEPAPGDAATDAVEVFHATYPDGRHDAEALFVTPDSDVFIITKGDPGPVALYRFPRPLESKGSMPLQRVGEPLAGRVDAKDRPTAADVSHSGEWVAVRTTHYVTFYRTTDLIAGRWRQAARFDLTQLGERRGEGLTFAAKDIVVLVGEGGGLIRSPGTFATLACELTR